MTQTLYASFNDPALAEKAMGALLDHGGKADDMSLIATEAYREKFGRTYSDNSDTSPTIAPGSEFADDPDTVYDHAVVDTTPRENRGDIEAAAKQGISTTTPADAGAGALAGTGVGLGVGALAALASLFIPGVGLVVGGGALATAIGAAAATAGAGAIAGGVTGYLVDMGMPDTAVHGYEDTIKAGGAIIAVNVPSGGLDRSAAEDLLMKYGSRDVNSYTPNRATAM